MLNVAHLAFTSTAIVAMTYQFAALNTCPATQIDPPRHRPPRWTVLAWLVYPLA